LGLDLVGRTQYIDGIPAPPRIFLLFSSSSFIMFGKDQKRPLKMSLEQTLEQERKEILRNLDGLKSPKVPRADNSSRIGSGRGKNLSLLRKNNNTQQKSESGRRASVSSPLASSSPWTNTLLSEWDDGIYEPSDEADEAEPERRSSDSVTQLKREKEKKQRALKEREVDIDAGFLYGMQPTVPHIVLPQRHASSKSSFIIPNSSNAIIQFLNID
jgi:hypothetical protein